MMASVLQYEPWLNETTVVILIICTLSLALHLILRWFGVRAFGIALLVTSAAILLFCVLFPDL